MRTISAILVSCLPVTLLGCSIHPIPDDVTRQSTFGIVQQIRCEARRAVLDHGQRFVNGAIAYEFDFKITEVNNASAGATGTLPFINGGSFSIMGNAGINRTRDADRNFKLVDTFDDLKKMNCTQEALDANWIYPIAGDIGTYEVVSTFMRLNRSEHLTGNNLFTFADVLAFTTDLSAGLHPSLTLLPVTGGFRVTSANGDFTADRTDIHKVTLSLSGGEQPQGIAAARRRAGARLAIAPLGTTISPLGATIFAPGVETNSSLLSTTIIQSGASAPDRALIELDRQRILQLQARSQNLVVGP